MGLFDFVGTFFFLSLGITFVLILLLVYHFKQRLTEMEQKSDKMFEIVNTIVKEMGNMRRAIAQEAQPQIHQMCMRGDTSCDYQYKHEDMEGATDCEDEDEDGDDEPNIVEDAPMVFELGCGQEDMNKFFKIQKHEDDDLGEHEQHMDDDEQHDHEEVKVVSVDLTYHGEDIDDEPYISDLEENDEASVVVPELHTAIGEEVIHVNKLDETTPVEVEDEHVDESHQVSYHKMNLSQLRAYAVSRGLLSDSSKLKKAELIKLLESNDE